MERANYSFLTPHSSSSFHLPWSALRGGVGGRGGFLIQGWPTSTTAMRASGCDLPSAAWSYLALGSGCERWPDRPSVFPQRDTRLHALLGEGRVGGLHPNDHLALSQVSLCPQWLRCCRHHQHHHPQRCDSKDPPIFFYSTFTFFKSFSDFLQTSPFSLSDNSVIVHTSCSSSSPSSFSSLTSSSSSSSSFASYCTDWRRKGGCCLQSFGSALGSANHSRLLREEGWGSAWFKADHLGEWAQLDGRGREGGRVEWREREEGEGRLNYRGRSNGRR